MSKPVRLMDRQRQPIPSHVRRTVYSMSGGHCAKCRTSLVRGGGAANSFHIDHIRPVSRGGGNDISNLQPLCRTCNLSKGAHNTNNYRAAPPYTGPIYWVEQQAEPEPLSDHERSVAEWLAHVDPHKLWQEAQRVLAGRRSLSAAGIVQPNEAAAATMTSAMIPVHSPR